MSQYTNPKSWGPHFWFMMRCIAHNYGEYPSSSEKRVTEDFYTNLKYLLPCNKCKKHYADLLEEYPVKENLCCKSCRFQILS